MKIAPIYNLTVIQKQHDMKISNQIKLISVENTLATLEIQRKLQKEQTQLKATSSFAHISKNK